MPVYGAGQLDPVPSSDPPRARRTRPADKPAGADLGSWSAWEHEYPTASPPSPSPPPWPSTPRPRPSRPPAGRSSASGPASPTSRPRTTSSRPRSRPPAIPKNHRYTPGARPARAARARSRPRPCATPATRSTPAQVLVTNGGKQAVYNTFAALLDPGDEVLLLAPYWTTYPEAIKLAGGVPVEVMTDETTGYLASVEQLEAARTAAHQGAAVRLAVQPDRRRVPARPGRGDRPVGRRARALGRHRRDLRAPGLRRRAQRLDRHRGARARRSRRRAQRGRQDLRDDRLAGRLDDRAGRRDQGRVEPAVALHVERLQRRPGRRAGGGQRRPRPRWPRCATAFDRRRQHDRRRCSARSRASSARSRRAPSTSTRRSRACSAGRCAGKVVDQLGRAGRGDPGRGRGRRRARRGVRHARLRCGCPTRSATTTWPRASAGSPSSSPTADPAPRDGRSVDDATDTARPLSQAPVGIAHGEQGWIKAQCNKSA